MSCTDNMQLCKVLTAHVSPAGSGDTIASDRQVALQLLASPVSEEPQGITDLEAFLFAASARLPVSVQPFQLIKSVDPDLADALYLSGDCRIRRVMTAALLLSDRMPGQSICFLRCQQLLVDFCCCCQQSYMFQCLQILEVALIGS